MKPVISVYLQMDAKKMLTTLLVLLVVPCFVVIVKAQEPFTTNKYTLSKNLPRPVFSYRELKAMSTDDTASSATFRYPDSTIALFDTATSSISPNKKRINLIIAANAIGYGGTMVGLYAAWYSKYKQTGFHTFNDFPEWKQMDKAGHMYSAYIESVGSMEMWRWTGIDRKKRIWIGGMSGAVYQTVIEVLDGFSEGWGWSWGDFGANIVGSATLVAQELAWNEQRIRLKFSFHRKSYGDPQLGQRSNQLFGKSTAERLLKDYNGQTYWASVNLRSFAPKSKLPAWLAVSIGYGAEGLFGGVENIARDENGNITFNRPDVKRYRQWYLSPDIDLSKIKTNKKAVRLLLTVLNAFKFPLPALELSNGRLKAHAFYF